MHPALEPSELNARIGQLFMAGIPGPEPDPETEALIRDHCLGGIILFGRNIEDPIQLARLCHALQERAIRYHGEPLFLAVDQEGGRVARLKEPFTIFPGNAAIGEDKNPVDMAREFARVTAREMALVGLNMDLAPVVDVRRGKPEKHLEGRVFSDDPEKVALLGRTVVKTLQENGILAVAKHFPGLGRTTLDPHHHLPTINVDLGEIEETNLTPFKATFTEDVSSVMTSHAIYPALDPDNPASLSKKILTELLRTGLGFEGLIITDDLEMGAIKKGWSVPGGAMAAFDAGADILLICQDQNMVLESMKMLRENLQNGEIPSTRIHGSLERIMKAKARFLKRTPKISLDQVRSYFDL